MSIARWKHLLQPWRAWHVSERVTASDKVPGSLINKEVVLVGKPGNETWAVFDCPCRKGHRLMLNLDGSRHPLWRITSYHPLSIWPSIYETTLGQDCHFVVKNGRIIWVPPSRLWWWPFRQNSI